MPTHDSVNALIDKMQEAQAGALSVEGKFSPAAIKRTAKAVAPIAKVLGMEYEPGPVEDGDYVALPGELSGILAAAWKAATDAYEEGVHEHAPTGQFPPKDDAGLDVITAYLTTVFKDRKFLKWLKEAPKPAEEKGEVAPKEAEEPPETQPEAAPKNPDLAFLG